MKETSGQKGEWQRADFDQQLSLVCLVCILWAVLGVSATIQIILCREPGDQQQFDLLYCIPCENAANLHSFRDDRHFSNCSTIFTPQVSQRYFGGESCSCLRKRETKSISDQIWEWL